MRLFQLFSLAAASTPALADTHYFFSGFFSGSTIVGVEFDDQTHSLTLKNNITTDASAGSKWIALDSRLKNLYVGTTGYFQSYSITDDLGLSYSSNVSLPSGCSNANFIASSTAAPYTVFGTPYGGGCSSLAITVDESGVLQEATANVTYDSAAGVHGTSLSPQNDFIYSADDMGNAVWVHSYDNTTGEVGEVQYLAAAEGSNPRHLTVHPNGNWVYVVYEEANSIASYKRDPTTGKLTFTNTTYSLLPSGYTNTSSYWADEVLFSIPSGNASAAAPKYLLAATRSRTVGVPGYVSAFALDGASGAVTEQLFLLPTTNSGGSANAVSPAPFSEDYFAITDSGSNFLEVWKIDAAAGASVTASAVAHLGLASGPANVVWYS
ncbi:Putative WD40/YVTN repeat-like-containing domain superfamily, lactonase, 7-bladed beta propeller [Colletotrichum destructivum]|uniref:WD40/YVTN repeat-like-containing domain superfamily, lactonase, 7-bladed beta propeller n=1 Tax=Colletotrichum destructivum TaxID=34406 RepID=A0AAX4IC71_9PEZI|nr:Putative WD40/YVTN repeat-like-containing domain superfamily, lactonase, 7-bladed beta propeller [Colletotrichum destructivum]